MRGDVYRLNDPDRILPILDAYEGCNPNEPLPHEFERATVLVRMEDGTSISTTAYLYCANVTGLRMISSGEFLTGEPL